MIIVTSGTGWSSVSAFGTSGLHLDDYTSPCLQSMSVTPVICFSLLCFIFCYLAQGLQILLASSFHLLLFPFPLCFCYLSTQVLFRVMRVLFLTLMIFSELPPPPRLLCKHANMAFALKSCGRDVNYLGYFGELV